MPSLPSVVLSFFWFFFSLSFLSLSILSFSLYLFLLFSPSLRLSINFLSFSTLLLLRFFTSTSLPVFLCYLSVPSAFFPSPLNLPSWRPHVRSGWWILCAVLSVWRGALVVVRWWREYHLFGTHAVRCQLVGGNTWGSTGMKSLLLTEALLRQVMNQVKSSKTTRLNRLVL